MDISYIRNLFPITQAEIKTNKYGRELIYLDHAASTHPSKPVLDKYLNILQNTYANVHRAEHELSCISTDMFEEVPPKIARFMGINNYENSGMQVVLTTNTTSSLDLAAHLFADKEGKVLTTLMEHHSNDLPHRRRGDVEHVDVTEKGMLDYDDLEEKLQNHDIKVVAVTAGSNVTGYMPDVHRIARMAHNAGAKIIVDAAQRLAHAELEVKPIDHPEHLDFIAGAGHKFYAPFGSAFLMGNTQEFNEAPPYIPGGGTVSMVMKNDVLFLDGPDRHQPGTPNIAGAIAMGKALEFLSEIGMENIRKHEVELMKKIIREFNNFDNVTILGDIPLSKKLGVISFNIDDQQHKEVSHQLDAYAGIATRNGCFCAHPYLHELLGYDKMTQLQLYDKLKNGEDPDLPGAVRASIGLYNSREEIDKLISTVDLIRQNKVKSLLSV